MKQSVKLIVGNWKMNGASGGVGEFERLVASLTQTPRRAAVAICPPATLIERLCRIGAPAGVGLGGQDCHEELSGAYTGSVSAGLLAEAGATHVIVGHSERRQAFGETDADVAAKAAAAVLSELTPIICVGETLAEREAGQAMAVVTNQVLRSLTDALAGRTWALAYEPIWAIGTGQTPTLAQIAEIHATARAAMIERLGTEGATPPILYGGSVNPGNAREILEVPEVGGALVGGASLKADDFLAIIGAAEAACVAADAQGC